MASPDVIERHLAELRANIVGKPLRLTAEDLQGSDSVMEHIEREARREIRRRAFAAEYQGRA